jgi:formamidopyrimidine-DNA glycosylase
LRHHLKGEKLPQKHQLLLEFDDGTAMSSTIQMWGGLFCFSKGEKCGFPDYNLAKERPSPLSPEFRVYFDGLFDENTGKLSAKAFLATEQRIPGLGNGVLQDILWTAKIHPRRKMVDIPPAEIEQMFHAIGFVLQHMIDRGGRDTERDLYGCFGGYKTILSKNTVDTPCPACGTVIVKEPYLGGSIYYCGSCQK